MSYRDVFTRDVLVCILVGWLEKLSYNLERGSDVYVVLLDINKAFDNVWIDGLMYRLFEIGIDL